MSDGRPTRADVSRSYHPRGFVSTDIHKGGNDESASLQRARKPFVTRNFLTGAAIVTFILGTYAYSIAAVKQDDFSDVVDLLPPESERANIRTLEDEAREAKEKARLVETALGAGVIDAEPVVAALATPSPPATDAPRASVLSYLTPKRLSEVEWFKKSGLVEEGKGNLLVWGAPNVDKVGSMRDGGDSRGRRLV